MTSAPRPSTLLARMAVDALARAGVTHVVVCPGSRSAPLAYALAEHAPATMTVLVRHDERAAAFTALGVGRSRAGRGAVVTTSGTAVANLHPAVLEASHSLVPLVVVTADRPPAWRGTWANQTSKYQSDLFGRATRSTLDLDDAATETAPDVAWQALLAALQAGLGVGAGELPGPVHLNLGFADPLVPAEEDDAAVAEIGEDAERRPGIVVRRRKQAVTDDELEPGPRTLVVAGDGAGWQARWCAEAGGWPLLAEPSSGARGGANAVGPYRLLLELEAFADQVERVVVFGRPTLSRPVARLLAREDVDLVVASPYGAHPDPGREARRVGHNVSPAGLGDRAKGWFLAEPDPWLLRWRTAGAAAQAALDARLELEANGGGPGGGAGLTGPLVASLVWGAATEAEPLVVAASNPIRDLDLVAAPREAPGAETVGAGWLVVANRGLSGIDGTLSTATGVALACGRPTRALVGDVAFVHDLNGLLADPAVVPASLQVIVVNDDGGGIFSLLEHGARAEGSPARAEVFERVFGTPHGADLAALCAGYRVPHQRVKDAAGLRTALESPEPGLGVVEVCVDRGGLRELHERLRTVVHDAVGGLDPAAPTG